MKEKTKLEKGITLIALIITIVVLLILAAVAISSITNDGILHYAQNAADNWNKAAQNEANMLGDYLNYLNNVGLGSGETTKIISFILEGTPYTTEEGTTWEKWLENVDDAYICDECGRVIIYRRLFYFYWI